MRPPTGLGGATHIWKLFFYCLILGILYNIVLKYEVIVLKFKVNPTTFDFLRPPAGLGALTYILKLFFLLFDTGYPNHHCVKIWSKSENFSFFWDPLLF